MMPSSLPLNKERKRLLAAGAVLLILGAIYRFYPDLHAMVSVSDEMAVKQKQVEAYAGIVAQRKQIEKENAVAKRIGHQMESRLLSGATPSLAAVEIQNLLNGVAAASQVELSTIRVLEPVEDKNAAFIRLPVQFSMTSDIVQLRDILYKVESSPKLLVVTDLDASQSRSRGPAALIRSTITVQGVMRRVGDGDSSSQKAG